MRIVLLPALVLVMTLAGCSEQPSAPMPERGQPTATYDVRGIIRELPDANTSELSIEHEAIADFKSADGSLAPMPSMTMDMGVADGLPLDNLKVGDPVAFTLAIWWKPRPAMQVTHIEKLPADTTLNLDAGHHGHAH